MNEQRLPEALGRKARELVEGMRKRVKRDPDVADYAAAFKPILEAAIAAEPASRYVPTIEVPPPIDKEQIIEIDENGNVHDDVSGLAK